MGSFTQFFKKLCCITISNVVEPSDIAEIRMEDFIVKANNDSRKHFKKQTQILTSERSKEEDIAKREAIQQKLEAARYMWLEKCNVERVDCKEDFFALLDRALMIKNPSLENDYPHSIVDFNKKVLKNKENPYQVIMEGKNIFNRLEKLIWLNEYGSHNPSSTFYGLPIMKNTDQSTVLHVALTNYFKLPNTENIEIIKVLLKIDLTIQHQRRDCKRTKIGLESFINMRSELGNKTAYDRVIEVDDMMLQTIFYEHAQQRLALSTEKKHYHIDPMKCSEDNFKKILKQKITFNRKSIISISATEVQKLAANLNIYIEEHKHSGASPSTVARADSDLFTESSPPPPSPLSISSPASIRRRGLTEQNLTIDMALVTGEAIRSNYTPVSNLRALSTNTNISTSTSTSDSLPGSTDFLCVTPGPSPSTTASPRSDGHLHRLLSQRQMEEDSFLYFRRASTKGSLKPGFLPELLNKNDYLAVPSPKQFGMRG